MTKKNESSERTTGRRLGEAAGSAQKPKTTLSFLAQQYGLTAEDLAEELGCSISDIITEPAPNKGIDDTAGTKTP